MNHKQFMTCILFLAFGVSVLFSVVPVQANADSAEADLEITKLSVLEAVFGQTVQYEYNITNLGPDPAFDVYVVDDVLGPLTLTGLIDEDGDGNADDLPAYYQTTISVSYTIPESSPDPLINSAVVNSTSLDPDLANNYVSWTMDILRTGVTIEKTGPNGAALGEMVTYTIKVINSGETDLAITSLVDDELGDLSGYISGGVITVTEGFEEFTVNDVIGGEIIGPNLDNTVDVIATNLFGADEVSATADHSIYILRTSVDIEKTGPSSAEVGESITYWVTITNTGETPLILTNLTDSVMGDLNAALFSIVTGPLFVDDSVTFPIPWTVQATPDPLINTMTIEAENTYGADPRSDSDDHTLDVQQLNTILGYKYEDLTGDGLSNDDAPLAGWTIQLFDEAGNLLAETITDTNGYYAFTSLPNGSYLVAEVVAQGWTPTNPTEYLGLVQNGDALMVNFTNYRNIMVEVWKFEDMTGDGWTNDDVPMVGWEVHLIIDEVIVDSQLTGADGRAVWDNLGPLAPGSVYGVRETMEIPWIPTSPSAVTFGTPLSGDMYSVVFTNFMSVEIYVEKYEDFDGDGDADTLLMQPEWPIQLWKGGVWIDSENTSLGSVLWSGLGPGNYSVQETWLPGWMPTSSPAVNLGTVHSGEVYVVTFTNFHLGHKSGGVYEDCSGNGASSDDQPLSGWTLRLLDAADQTLWITTTDTAGLYKFMYLPPGDYSVELCLPKGWRLVSPEAGRYHFTVTSGFIEQNNDFYVFKEGRISGTIYEDLEDDSSCGDTVPLSGWKVRLADPCGSVLAVTTTDACGQYTFGGLLAGRYTVEVCIPDGWVTTTPSPAQYKLTVTSGFNDCDNDFYVAPRCGAPSVNDYPPEISDPCPSEVVAKCPSTTIESIPLETPTDEPCDPWQDTEKTNDPRRYDVPLETPIETPTIDTGTECSSPSSLITQIGSIIGGLLVALVGYLKRSALGALF